MKRSLSIVVLTVVLVVAFALAGCPAAVQAQQTQIYFTNFNTSYSDWTTGGVVSGVNTPSIQPKSVRLNGAGAMIYKTISTVGYSSISLTWNMAASSLEAGEFCYVEYNTGSGWVTAGTLADGQDNSTFTNGTSSNIAGAGNNASFQVRYRIQTANASADYCYAEDTTVSGTAGVSTNTPTSTLGPTSTPTTRPTPTSTPAGVIPVPGDPLTGTGNVSRTVLTYSDLMTGSSTAPVDDSAFALPSNAAPANYTFEGSLQLTSPATQGGGAKIYKDSNRVFGSGDQPIKHLPAFNFDFVQNGSYLIPAIQGWYVTGNSYWNYIIGVGRAWNENGDSGYSRAAFPFALVEYNQNCVHNGVMTFLFNATSVSKVRYQITQETCYLEKIDFWGQLDATYSPHTVSNAMALKNNEAAEIANRLPTKPMSAIATDFPGSGFSESTLTSGITAADMTLYGLLVNGTNYVSGCTTRYGSYAFCSEMRVPSYSTAKSAMAGVAEMRLGQKYGASNVYNMLIKDYVPEYSSSAGVWTTVTLNHTLDMATGNYRLAAYESDENNNMNTFLNAVSYADKISAAFNFPNKKAPGTLWIYHTSDTFIGARAMNNYLVAQGGGTDIFNMLRDEVYQPLNMSTGFMTTLRTDNSSTGVPFAGYGLFWNQDDVAKLVKLLNSDHGVINGSQVLEPNMLDDTMQTDSGDRGMDTTGATAFKYNNGFWAFDYTTSYGYGCEFWTPFMSGYGGITVLMMPHGTVYYYFSDNNEFAWSASEPNKLVPMCP